MTTNIRRLGTYLLLSFAAVSGGLGWWQVVEAPGLLAREDNPQVIVARRAALHGTIFDASGEALATSQVTEGVSRRTFVDPAFSHVIGYASARFGMTGLERAFDDVLTGRRDPNPLRDFVNDVLNRPPEPRDLTLTIDRRLQHRAAQLIAGEPGAIVALDPRTGAVLAMVSSPSFDPTPISGDPMAAAGPMEELRGRADQPLIDRARLGRYVPGSVMKVLTAAIALESDAITPETTFEDQPRQEVEGFVVDGFRITEHELGGLQPDLWPLSEAMQVSSNIYFAHVGLEIGAERYLDLARRFGFCNALQIGSAPRALSVAPSYVTARAEGDCAPFSDRVELASAAFGQGRMDVTPMQLAILAATIANDGVMPRPFVVSDVRPHTADGSRSDEVLERYSGASRRSISQGTAREVRAVMVDAVEGELGRIFAGAGAVGVHGVAGVETAGKTGTAQRGEGLAPHSWFIGFAPAGDGATPSIAVAVLVEGGGAGAGRAAPIAGELMALWLQLTAEDG
jgi:penicillin-binding protein A